MKRPVILIPLVAVIAVVAVVAVAVAGKSNNNSNSTNTSRSTPYGSAAPAATPATPPAAGGGARIATADHGLGAMLVDAQGKALYLWKADTGTASMCSGECAQDWPPVTTSGAARAGGGAKASLLGTTKRSDGTTQVTYAGHPLYRYAGDTQAGQVTGQGSNAFGAPWWVLTPGGAAITRSAP
jgi:predicted lipoprotein with Yx(FWY)xxD motif